MLFDLEDYKTSKIIGPEAVDGADKVFWPDCETTFRATTDAYYKAINEYAMASAVFCTSEMSKQIDLDMMSIAETQAELGPISREYWAALTCLPLKGLYEVGDKFDFGFHMYGPDSSWTVIDKIPVAQYYIDNGYNSKWATKLNQESGEFTYTELTQELYDSYVNKIKELQAKVKTLWLHSEGRESLDVYVAPEIPAWAEYPELTGYVRNSNSLPIAGAIVKLTDANNEVHEVVTDAKGYYKFSKEFIYNNVALGDLGTSGYTAHIEVSKTKTDNTVLFDETNILQNSFYGAENDRGLTWPVYLKMNKPARANIKVEFIPDYSVYPSLSGYIKDQDGNPVANALVELYLSPESFTNNEGESTYHSAASSIGARYNPNGVSWTKSSKYILFGEEKSLLTDENGYYEYPSQMIGEWIHNEYHKYLKDVDFSSAAFLLDKLLLNDPTTTATGYYAVPGGFGKGFKGVNWNGPGSGYQWTEMEDAVLQPDGKLIVVGGFGSYDTTSFYSELTNRFERSSIVRINTDGSIDDTFQVNIRNFAALVGWGENENYFRSVALQPDGKIILAGNIGTVDDVVIGTGTTRGMVRLNSDGSLDTAFDFSSLNLTDQHEIWKIKLLSDGKVLVNIFSGWMGSTPALVRFNADGTLDETFNLPVIFNNYSSILEDNGSLFITGAWNVLVDADGNNHDYPGIIKLNSDLTIDTTFRCPISLDNSSTPVIHSIIKEENGTYLIGGYFNKVTIDGSLVDANNLIRINSDGSVNDRFQGAACEWGGLVEYGVGYEVKQLSIVDTPAGKRILALYSGNVFHIDYVTGLSVQTMVGFDNEAKKMVLSGSDVYVIGKFEAYYEDTLDNEYGRFSRTAPGIAKLTYGNYEFFKNTPHSWFQSRNIEYFDGTNMRSLNYSNPWTVNTVQVHLNPWIQDPNGDVYDYTSKSNGVTEPTKIYNYLDWFNSRFLYAANDRYAERYLISLHGGEGKDVTLDINEILTDQESGAERAHFKYTKSTYYGTSNSGQWYPSFTFKSTSGYVMVKTARGEEIIGYGGTGSGFVQSEEGGLGGPDGNGWINYNLSAQDFNDDYKNPDGTWDIYFYACEPEHGAASGHINLLDVTDIIINDIDVTEMANLEHLYLRSRILDITPSATDNTVPVDVSGCTGLKQLMWDARSTHALNITGIDQIPDLKRLGMGGFAYTSKVESSTESQYTFDRSVFRYDGGSPYVNTSFGQAQGFVKMSDGKIIVIDSSGNYQPVYSANPDGTSIQLPPMKGIVRLNEDLSVDTTFNNYYTYFTTNPNLSNGFNSGVPVCIDKQSDEKIIIGGQFASYNEQNLDYSNLMRINPNGSRDNAFTTKLSQNSGLDIYYVSNVKVLSDDKILVCGDIYLNGTYKGLVKLNADGSRDTSFNIAEAVSYNGPANFTVQSTGKILASVENGYKVKRFNANGTLDSTFTVIQHNLGYGGQVKSIVVQSDDKIIVTGERIYTFYDEAWGGINLHVARFEPDGALDLPFNRKLAKYEIKTSSVDYTNVLSDGTIIISGNFNWYVYSPDLDLTLPSTEWVKIWEDNEWGINSTKEVKIVLDENGDEKVDYFPSNKGAYNYDMYRDFIEDGDNLWVLLPKETNFRYEDKETGDMCFAGIGKFVKRPKTTFKFEVNNSSLVVFNDNSGVSTGNYSGQNLKRLYTGRVGSLSISAPLLEELYLNNFKGNFNAVSNLSNLTKLNLQKAILDFETLNLPALTDLTVENSYSGVNQLDLTQTSLVNMTFTGNGISQVLIPETAKWLAFSNSGCPIFGESYVDYLQMNGGYAYGIDGATYTVKAKSCSINGVAFPTGNEVALIVDSGETSYTPGVFAQVNWCDLWQKDLKIKGYFNDFSIQGSSLRAMVFDTDSKLKYFTTSRHGNGMWFNNIDLTPCTDLVYFMYYDYVGANGTTVNLPTTTTLSEVRVIGDNWTGSNIKIAAHAEQMLQVLVNSGRTGGTVTLRKFQGSTLITTLKNTLVSRGWNVSVTS
jgi:uncharacterized delta-60 repeat protein